MQSLTPLAGEVGRHLKAAGHTVAVAESSSAGLVAAALLAVPGASAYFTGGGVIYTATAREALLGLTPQVLGKVRSATEAYARLLAERMRERLGTTWGLAETGAAGPDGNRYGDAPGHCCLAVVGPVERTLTLETGEADRETNMRIFAREALELLQRALREA